MTIEISRETDLSAIETAIENWVISASGIPNNGQIQATWAGYDTERIRPYVSMNFVSMPSMGRPCISQSKINEGGTDKIKTLYSNSDDWNIQMTFYTDAYDSDGEAVTERAQYYALNMKHRAFIPQNISILGSANIGYNKQSFSILPLVDLNTDEDKAIHQAAAEVSLNIVVDTASKDSDFFTTIDEPTLNLTE
ncbi:hypothetical protein KAR91_05060 [Candidatus Pacearchaeota archaeon]|nr:hypothetical protein [Candidatus Pacearchaeota archaeon]